MGFTNLNAHLIRMFDSAGPRAFLRKVHAGPSQADK